MRIAVAETKEKVASAIARAQMELEEALSELDVMSAYDPRPVSFTAHALKMGVEIWCESVLGQGSVSQFAYRHMKNRETANNPSRRSYL